MLQANFLDAKLQENDLSDKGFVSVERFFAWIHSRSFIEEITIFAIAAEVIFFSFSDWNEG